MFVERVPREEDEDAVLDLGPSSAQEEAPSGAAFTPAEYQASLRRGRPSMKIERGRRGAGSRAKWPLSVRTVSGSGGASKSSE